MGVDVRTAEITVYSPCVTMKMFNGDSLDNLTNDEILSRVIDIEMDIASNFEQIEFDLEHHFCDGLYSRTIFLPKGSLLVGHIHKNSCINVISKGRIMTYSIDGKHVHTGHCVMPGQAGVKRAGVALEDTIWTTIHLNPDNETDLDKLKTNLTIDRELTENRIEQVRQGVLK